MIHLKQNKKAFTLTELMAVVIIIAILAGIGFGTYKKAVERSRFNEGLVAGNAVLESVTRYYYDNPDLTVTERKRPKAEYLDIGISNSGDCTSGSREYCFKTKYFEIIIQNWGVQVNRMQGTTPKDYYLYLYPDFSGRQLDACLSRSETGYDLCKLMGYNSCSGSGASYTCRKS